MIHSLSGGVLADRSNYLFVKVLLDGAGCWYLCPDLSVREGDLVLVPFGKAELPREGQVLRVLSADAQTAPVSPARAKTVYKILGENPANGLTDEK